MIVLLTRGDWAPLEDAYETLLPNEQAILDRRYGLRPNDPEKRSLRQTARELGLSDTWVRTVERRAIRKLAGRL